MIFRKIFIIVFLFFSDAHAYIYDLAVCAIFQNEERFLDEWIRFHRLMGVQRFYLYNNNSTDNFMTVLKPYIKAKIVNVINWNYPMHGKKIDGQRTSYNHCLKHVRGRVKWLAIIDIDEFLFPVQKNNLRDFLKEYESCDTVCANWLMFGTSDIELLSQDKLLIEQLTMCNYTAPANIHVKSIVRPEKVKEMYPHNPIFFNVNVSQVTPDKIKFLGPFAPSVALDKLRINHYWVRDKKWLREVKIPRRLLCDAKATPESIEKDAQLLNKEHDVTILRFKSALQKV